MKIIRNSGNGGVIDLLHPRIEEGRLFDLMTSHSCLFAFAELVGDLEETKARQILPSAGEELSILGDRQERSGGNQLRSYWMAKRYSEWGGRNDYLQQASSSVSQGAIVLRDVEFNLTQGIIGALSFSTIGLGITPGNPLNLIKASETPEEGRILGHWFDNNEQQLVLSPFL